MTDLENRCLESFPSWLRALGEDARALADLLEREKGSVDARRPVAGALNYLFKSLDLIPDGIEDLGFIDDAFVFRVAAAQACELDSDMAGVGVLSRLSADAALVAEFLESDYPRLQKHVGGLSAGSARGRSVDDILGDGDIRSELLREVKAWAETYQSPSFARDPKNLVKLRSFLAAKLPAADGE